jgi:S-adenosylhomocysteine hydrolase
MTHIQNIFDNRYGTGQSTDFRIMRQIKIDRRICSGFGMGGAQKALPGQKAWAKVAVIEVNPGGR